MSQYQDGTPFSLPYGRTANGVPSFFNAVYAWMFVGLAVTAGIGLACSSQPAVLKAVYGTPGVTLVVVLGLFALSVGIERMINRISAATATALFLVYAAVLGVLLSRIFVIYPHSVLAASFMMTGGVFGAMSLYGYFTKRDLTSVGSIAVMCVFGLFAASIVNYFLASDALSWFITYAVLAAFIVITAYDTQKLRQIAEQLQDSPAMLSKYAIIGSLRLYIDFINIFLSILRIMGGRR